MAAIADADISINAAGDIRWTGAATTNRHSVLEFIQWLQDKHDDERQESQRPHQNTRRAS